MNPNNDTDDVDGGDDVENDNNDNNKNNKSGLYGGRIMFKKIYSYRSAHVSVLYNQM